jgi:glycosyltransferase involved in cell wall biosynthesis
MSHGVPVMARNTGGMPEALCGAGMLFEDAEPRVLAELMHTLATLPCSA